LWELLCGQKLFKASNELATLKKIQQCNIPLPSSINKNIKKELDDIVMKSLQKDRNLRFENMDELNRVLVKYLYSNYPDFNEIDLKKFASKLFKNEIENDRKVLHNFGKIDISSYMHDYNNDLDGTNNIKYGKITRQEQKEMKLDVEDLEMKENTKNKNLMSTNKSTVALKRSQSKYINIKNLAKSKS
jgi:hypothetical protein